MKYVYRKRILILFVSILDFFGKIIVWPFRKINPPGMPQKISRLLVIRVDHIGDIIMSTAVLKPLRESFPKAKIDFIAPSWGIDLVKGNSNVDQAIEFDPSWFNRKTSSNIFKQLKSIIALAKIIRQGKYDAAIDLRGDLRHIISMSLAGVKYRVSYGITGGAFLLSHEVPYTEGVHEIEHSMDLLRAIGVQADKVNVDIKLKQEELKDASFLLKEYKIAEPYAVMHVAPGHKTKTWESENFSKVIDHITGRDIQCVMVGTENDRKTVRDILSITEGPAYDLSGKTDLKTLVGIIKGSVFFVGVDSAPAHVAAALGIPTVILFSGINDPVQWAPKGDNVEIVYPGKGKDLSSVSPKEVCKKIDEAYERKE